MLKLTLKTLLRIIVYIEKKRVLIINKMILLSQSVDIGLGIKIQGRIHIVNKGYMRFSDNVKLNSSVVANPISHHSCSFFTAENGKLIIGEDSGLSGCTIYAVECIKIGKRVLIGAGTNIYDTDFHSLNLEDRCDGDSNIKIAPVFISDDCFIGANVTILKGVSIGKGSVVAACSVVTRDVGENELWGGNPARLIREKING